MFFLTKSYVFKLLYLCIGALPNFLLIVPEKAIKLGVNDYMRHQLRKDGKISVSSDVIAGGTAGLCQVCFTDNYFPC